MYETFYGFHTKPFTALPDPEFLYLSAKHDLALTYLEYGITAQAGFMVLTGEVGSGKTTLLNYLLQTIDSRKIKTALVFNTNVTPHEFLECVLQEWGLDCRNKSKSELYHLLNEFLLGEYTHGHNVMLIVDEAQNLSFETLEEIRMLSNLNDEKTPLLHIVLSGQPNLKERLNTPQLDQLRQRVSVHYHLDPLDLEETRAYIALRLEKAGAAASPVFVPEAVDRIYQAAAGIPRLINLVCDLSLVYGYAEQTRPIGPDIVDAVVSDRNTMGLALGRSTRAGSDPDTGTEASERFERMIHLEKKLRDLSDNVYQLALIVRRMTKFKDYIEQQQRAVADLQDRLDRIESGEPDARRAAAGDTCAGGAT